MGERPQPEVERLYMNNWEGFKRGSPVEVRSSGGTSRTVGGYGAVFNTRSMPLARGLVEIVEPSCWNKSKSNGFPGVVCRFEHDSRMLLGATASGTLRCEVDSRGLMYECDLPEARSDVYELISRGDVRNSSVAFAVWSDDFTHDGDILVRHLVSAQLIDTAPVSLPAYPAATVGLRSVATHFGAEYSDVVQLAERGELRSLYARTDNRGPAPRPAPTPLDVAHKPKINQYQAQLELEQLRHVPNAWQRQIEAYKAPLTPWQAKKQLIELRYAEYQTAESVGLDDYWEGLA